MSSVHTVPLLYLNLGGEMLYILDQRLAAQRIARDKAVKVMNDIVGIMFNDRFLKELFKPQEVYNKHALRKLFEDLAHASIMRLNQASMDKLYDLMTMTFKYQLFMASQPLDIIFITLNHLDSVRKFVPSPTLQKQIDFAYEILIDKYGCMSLGELQNIRYCLLNFFQDLNVRITVFLKQGVQQEDGKFLVSTSGPVPTGCEVPGCIRIYGWDGQLIQERQFETIGQYIPSEGTGSLDKHGKRGTKLGCNVYSNQGENGGKSIIPDESQTQKVEEPASEFPAVGREELNLLMAQLLGQRVTETKEAMRQTHFQLNLFSQETEEEEACEVKNHKDTINIDVSNHPRSAVLSQIYGDLTIDESAEDDISQDIVDMIDNLL